MELNFLPVAEANDGLFVKIKKEKTKKRKRNSSFMPQLEDLDNIAKTTTRKIKKKSSFGKSEIENVGIKIRKSTKNSSEYSTDIVFNTDSASESTPKCKTRKNKKREQISQSSDSTGVKIQKSTKNSQEYNTDNVLNTDSAPECNPESKTRKNKKCAKISQSSDSSGVKIQKSTKNSQEYNTNNVLNTDSASESNPDRSDSSGIKKSESAPESKTYENKKNAKISQTSDSGPESVLEDNNSTNPNSLDKDSTPQSIPKSNIKTRKNTKSRSFQKSEVENLFQTDSTLKSIEESDTDNVFNTDSSSESVTVLEDSIKVCKNKNGIKTSKDSINSTNPNSVYKDSTAESIPKSNTKTRKNKKKSKISQLSDNENNFQKNARKPVLRSGSNNKTSRISQDSIDMSNPKITRSQVISVSSISSNNEKEDVISVGSSEYEVFSQEETFVTANGDSVLFNRDDKESVSSLKRNDLGSKSSLNNQDTEKTGKRVVQNSVQLNSLPSKSIVDIPVISVKKSSNKPRTPVPWLKRSNTFDVDQFNLSKSPSMQLIRSATEQFSLFEFSNKTPPKTKRGSSNIFPYESMTDSSSNRNRLSQSMSDIFLEIEDSSVETSVRLQKTTRKISTSSRGSDSDISWHATKSKPQKSLRQSNRSTLDFTSGHNTDNSKRSTFNADINIPEVLSVKDEINLSSNNSKLETKDSPVEISACLQETARKSSTQSRESDSDISWHAPKSKLPKSLRHNRSTLDVSSSGHNTEVLKRNTYNADLDVPEMMSLNEEKINLNNDSKKSKRDTFNAHNEDLEENLEIAIDTVEKPKRGTFNVDEFSCDCTKNTSVPESDKESKKSFQNMSTDGDFSCRTTKSNSVSSLKKSTSKMEKSASGVNYFKHIDGTLKRSNFGSFNNALNNSSSRNSSTRSLPKKEVLRTNKSKKVKKSTVDMKIDVGESVKLQRSSSNNRDEFGSARKKLKKDDCDVNQVNMKINTYNADDVDTQLNTTFEILENQIENSNNFKNKLSSSMVLDSDKNSSPKVKESVLNNLNITLRNRRRQYTLLVSEEETEANISTMNAESAANQRDIFKIIENNPEVGSNNFSLINPEPVLFSDNLINRDSLFPNSLVKKSTLPKEENANSRRSARKTWNLSAFRSQEENARLSSTQTAKPSFGNQLVLPSCDSPGAKSPRKKWNISQNVEKKNSRLSFMLTEDSFLNQSTNQSLVAETTLPSESSTPFVKKTNKSFVKKALTNKMDKILTLGKMPDFSKIHKRAFEKMENIQEMRNRKAARAQFLLSGQKPVDNTSILHKSGAESRKQLNFNPTIAIDKSNNKLINLSKSDHKMLTKKRNSLGKNKNLSKPEQLLVQKHKRKSLEMNKENQPKKRLSLEKVAKKAHNHPSKIPKSQHQAPAPSRIAVIPPKKPIELKTIPVHSIPKPVFSVPKMKKEPVAVQTKAMAKKIESIKAVATKTKGNDSSIQDRSRDTMKGVRMNRRFELWMQMREKKT